MEGGLILQWIGEFHFRIDGGIYLLVWGTPWRH